MIIVSYCTPKYDAIYRRHLKQSLEKNKSVTHLHFEEPECGNWTQNTWLKPDVILKALKQDSSVLYIDVDGEVRSPSVKKIDGFIPKEYDGGFVMLPHASWYGNDSEVVEPLTGTLFFRRSAIPKIKRWRDVLIEKGGTDGEAFAEVFKDDFNMFLLGIEWCYINDTPAGKKGGIPCSDPLIVHYQASRKMRLV